MEYKTLVIKVPKYDPETGLKLEWEKGFAIKIIQENDTVILQANENGLMSLAKHLITLANPEVPGNIHFHLDDSNSLEEGSSEIIIEKINNFK
jgi:hypothetical protein